MKTLFTLVCLVATFLLSTPVQAQTKTAAKPAVKSPTAKAPATAKPSAKSPVAATAKPVAKPATAATKPAEAPTAPLALVTDKMEQPATNTGALKVRAETNPVTKRLTVRTNASGPTRVEINGPDGRPVITRDLLSSNDVATLDVSGLPAGAYIVQCTSGERHGMKRVMVGQ
ncbi:T9SS type A sorting domain-containing protein [Hymenobacter sediminicola]|uniref:T9SS type A sorting domain-containing protein n=1 Tax=Hymenobacter sediminicola TaxID=2761579 RepID=A0A7G7W743_9BACT|nr:T9SS type A sorting domain-containing protein [Hymenobacter sediminicola]QNH62186.1 T9SS type A sorting domain-containing protein [Hymenobacter sediminicola]